MWNSMRRRCTWTCWQRGALQRRILEWHLRALQNSRIIGLGVHRTWWCSCEEGLEHSGKEWGTLSRAFDIPKRVEAINQDDQSSREILLSCTICCCLTVANPSFMRKLCRWRQGQIELAMDDEMESLMKNQTWELVELLESKWALHNNGFTG